MEFLIETIVEFENMPTYCTHDFSYWSLEIVIYIISGTKAILQDLSVKIADDEGVSPSSSVLIRVSCNML
jgi:hypothetical protein